MSRWCGPCCRGRIDHVRITRTPSSHTYLPAVTASLRVTDSVRAGAASNRWKPGIMASRVSGRDDMEQDLTSERAGLSWLQLPQCSSSSKALLNQLHQLVPWSDPEGPSLTRPQAPPTAWAASPLPHPRAVPTREWGLETGGAGCRYGGPSGARPFGYAGAARPRNFFLRFKFKRSDLAS